MNVEFVDQVWWYTSRSAGIVSWVILSLSILAGLSISTRTTQLPPTWRIDLHRFLSSLGIVFVTVHIVALVPDDFVHFGWAELFVPYASEWRPGAVAWGVVAFWLLVAVEISSLVRQRIPHRLWRSLHFTAFLLWSFATVHLLTAGTDAGHGLFRATQVVLIAAVIVMTIRRGAVAVLRRRRRRSIHVGSTGDRREAVGTARL